LNIIDFFIKRCEQMSVRNEQSSPGGPLLKLGSGLSIGYGRVLAVNADEISLAAGTHYLLARNGRGKTTLLKTLVGLVKPMGGEYSLRGACQFVGDELTFDRELSSRQVLKSLIAKDRREEAFAMADVLELDVKKPFGTLSFGNRKKVGLLVGEFNIDPEVANVVLFDEPFTGLDTPARECFQNHWAATSDGVARLVSCHPDFDEMEMPSAVIISNEEVFQGGDGKRSWGELKALLN
jgi:ABC-type multidrug transport system ATPase subunit